MTLQPILNRMALYSTEGSTRQPLLTAIEQILPDMPDYDHPLREMAKRGRPVKE